MTTSPTRWLARAKCEELTRPPPALPVDSLSSDYKNISVKLFYQFHYHYSYSAANGEASRYSELRARLVSLSYTR